MSAVAFRGSFFFFIRDAWMTYLNRWELKAIHTEVPCNFYSVTKLHIHHLFITITIAFVWSILNLVSLLTMQRCRCGNPCFIYHQKDKNLIKDDYIQQESVGVKYQLLVSQLSHSQWVSLTRLHIIFTHCHRRIALMPYSSRWANASPRLYSSRSQANNGRLLERSSTVAFWKKCRRIF